MLLDPSTAIIAVGTTAAVVVDAYVFGARSARKELKDEGTTFANQHQAACQTLVKGAGINLATRINQSPEIKALIAPATVGSSPPWERPEFASGVREIEGQIADFRKTSHVHERLFEVRDGFEKLGEIAHKGWASILGAIFLTVVSLVSADQGIEVGLVLSGVGAVYGYLSAAGYLSDWIREQPKVTAAKRQLDKDLRERHYFPTPAGEGSLSSPPAA